jgi:hypothetical protein
MIKMLEYLKNVKLTRSAVSFIVGAIVILLFLKQCNSIENLKNEKELAQKEAKRAMNNLLAEQDSVRVLIKENGGIVASKRTFEYTIAELQSNNKDLVSEYKEALGDIKNLKDVNSLLKTEIAVVSNVKSDPSVITQSSDTTATIAFEKSDDFGKGNSRKFKGSVAVGYNAKKFSAEPGQFEITQNIKLYAMTDEKDGMKQIRIATDYPGITFGEIENINLINNKLNKPTKKGGWSIGVGLGYGYSLSSGQVINLGPNIGVGLFYSPKWLRF